MKYAIVHDDFFQKGGAENVVLSFLKIFDNSELFTSMIDKKKFPDIKNINTSFMQKIPFKSKLYKKMFFIYPLAFESFNFDNFDIFISYF